MSRRDLPWLPDSEPIFLHQGLEPELDDIQHRAASAAAVAPQVVGRQAGTSDFKRYKGLKNAEAIFKL